MRKCVRELADNVLEDAVLGAEDALSLAAVDGPDLYLLFAEASRIREHFKGNAASLCSIINLPSFGERIRFNG